MLSTMVSIGSREINVAEKGLTKKHIVNLNCYMVRVPNETDLEHEEMIAVWMGELYVVENNSIKCKV